jgi:hypothetical protein
VLADALSDIVRDLAPAQDSQLAKRVGSLEAGQDEAVDLVNEAAFVTLRDWDAMNRHAFKRTVLRASSRI